jgi:hypothetical protein
MKSYRRAASRIDEADNDEEDGWVCEIEEGVSDELQLRIFFAVGSSCMSVIGILAPSVPLGPLERLCVVAVKINVPLPMI